MMIQGLYKRYSTTIDYSRYMHRHDCIQLQCRFQGTNTATPRTNMGLQDTLRVHFLNIFKNISQFIFLTKYDANFVKFLYLQCMPMEIMYILVYGKVGAQKDCKSQRRKIQGNSFKFLFSRFNMFLCKLFDVVQPSFAPPLSPSRPIMFLNRGYNAQEKNLSKNSLQNN